MTTFIFTSLIRDNYGSLGFTVEVPGFEGSLRKFPKKHNYIIGYVVTKYVKADHIGPEKKEKLPIDIQTL
jgi:hypothetical protein